MTLSAKRSWVTVTGTVTMHSDERVELRGKEILIEAREKVVLQSNGLLIELAPDKTTISGKIALKGGATIEFTGNPDKLTA
jgi:hypothetical protein